MLFLQVILAIALVIIFFIIGFAIYNMEFIKSVRQAGVIKTSVPVFTGIKDLSTVSNEVYNTQDKSSGSYVPIGPSYNQPAGSEYTYNFWLYINRDKVFSTATTGSDRCVASTETQADAGFKDNTTNSQVVLLLKGNKELGTYNTVCSRTTNVKTKRDVIVKNPLIKLEQCGKYLTVEFNTVQAPEAVIENAPDVCSTLNTSWVGANSHKIMLQGLDKESFNKQWFMVTVIVQDTYPSDPYPVRNKVRCRIYINGLLELDKYVDTSISSVSTTSSASILKLNDGHLHVAPRITIGTNANQQTYKPSTTAEKGLMMADLNYYNYAIPADEIDTLFNAGFTTKMAPVPGGDNLDNSLYTIAPKPTSRQLN